MWWTLLLISVYCVLITAASLLGGWLPSLVRLTHARLQMMISFIGGLMLGVAVLHLLPHGIADLGSADKGMLFGLAGIVVTFFLIRAFHTHTHGEPVAGDESHPHSTAVPHVHDHDCGHTHDHDLHGHDHAHVQSDTKHRLSWIGIALGLTIHTLIDGISLAAGVAAEAHHAQGLGLYGLGIFLAVALHKPLDALSITSLMRAGGWSAGMRTAVNVVYSLMCPIGALLFFIGASRMGELQHLVVGGAVAFAGGVFLCIALGDLLPEIQWHSHDRLKLSVLLLLGVAAAYLIGYLEPEHAHSHSAPTTAHEHRAGHDHDGHDHSTHDHAGHDHSSHAHPRPRRTTSPAAGTRQSPVPPATTAP